MEPIHHKQPITKSDMDKIQYLFDHDKGASNLQRHVWFSLTLHLGLHGRELQTKILKTDLEIGKNDQGEYCRLSTDFATKYYQGGLGSSRRNSGAGIITAPNQILSIKLFLEKLHPNCARLFQRVRTSYSPRDKVWYCNAPLGKTTLNSMMTEILAAASLSKTYTYHCLRATVVSVLSAAGYEDRQIMAVTGHQNPKSLTSYARPTPQQQVEMSTALDRGTPAPDTETGCIQFSQEEVDQIFADLPVTTPNPTVESQTTGFDIDMLLSSATATELASVETPQPPQPSPFVYNFQGANFQGANVVFNITK